MHKTYTSLLPRIGRSLVWFILPGSFGLWLFACPADKVIQPPTPPGELTILGNPERNAVPDAGTPDPGQLADTKTPDPPTGPDANTDTQGQDQGTPDPGFPDPGQTPDTIATPEPEPVPEPSPTANVKILQPQANADVINPVTFSISARGVATVRLFSGTYPLSQPWDPTTRTTHTYTFNNVNTQHGIFLKGYDANGTEIASDNLTITVKPKPNQDKGKLIGKMWITYYYLSKESNYTGSATTTLYDSNCKALVKVIPKFSDSACIEGSGILKDGRVINYARTCSCGRRCPTGGTVCWKVLDKTKYPWGQGSKSRPLKPMRSLAVDRSIIPIGTKIYIAEWDGVKIPSLDGIGGFTHDGCFYADDVGGAIKGNHFDFFSGTSRMWKALEKIHATKKYLTVYRDPGRCP